MSVKFINKILFFCGKVLITGANLNKQICSNNVKKLASLFKVFNKILFILTLFTLHQNFKVMLVEESWHFTLRLPFLEIFYTPIVVVTRDLPNSRIYASAQIDGELVLVI